VLRSNAKNDCLDGCSTEMKWLTTYFGYWPPFFEKIFSRKRVNSPVDASSFCYVLSFVIPGLLG